MNHRTYALPTKFYRFYERAPPRLSWARTLAVAALVLFSVSPGYAAGTLEGVRARGYLNCGVGEANPGFSEIDAQGAWSGLEIEFCNAVAAAVFGDKTKVKYRTLNAADRFRALQTGEIDLLARATTWTLSRETELGLRFAGVLFYDGQGFLVRRDAGISSVLELSGASICVLPGTPAEQGLNDYFASRRMTVERVAGATWHDLAKAYLEGGCTLMTADLSVLASQRRGLRDDREHVILPDLITKEPIGPVVRQGDEPWFSIVRWTLMALIAAEEMDLTSATVEARRANGSAEVKRLLGAQGDLGSPMGLAKDWAYQVVRQVGSYQEIYDRTLGMKSPLRLERGVNNIWTKGGLMFAAPLR